MKKRFLALFVSLSLSISSMVFPMNKAHAGEALSEPPVYIMYHNTFDNGSADVKKASADGYDTENEYLIYDGTVGAHVQSASCDGNQGVRIKKSSHANGQTFRFDFTKSGTQEGIKSGIVRISFDFVLDPSSTANAVRIGMNMTSGSTYDGGRMIYFKNTNSGASTSGKVPVYGYSLCPNIGDYEKGFTSMSADTFYSFNIEMNFDTGAVTHTLNGDVIGTQTNLTGKTMNNFAIIMSGMMSYFDNLKLTHEYPYPVEYVIESENTGNIFYEDEPMTFTVTMKNRDKNNAYSENLVIYAEDAAGNDIGELLSESIEIAAGETKSFILSPTLDKFGAWVIKADSEHCSGFSTRAARSVRADKLNPELNVCAHFDGRHSGLSIPITFDLMEAIGISGVRSDYKFGVKTEESTDEAGNTVTNVVGFSETGGEDALFEQIAEESREHGISVLPILPPRCSYYAADADGGFNTSEEFLNAFYEYCKWVAEKYKGTIEWFELGNEDNYKTKPATQESETIMTSDKRAVLSNGYVYTEPGVYNKNVKKDTVNLTITDSKATLKSLDGTVTYYENLSVYEPEHGDDYAKILKAGYDGIKAGNPDAIVLNSGSAVVYTDENTIRNQREFAEELLGAVSDSGEKHFDVFGVHSYHTGAAPEIKDRWKMYTNWPEQEHIMTDLLEKYGLMNLDENKKTNSWATETGYYSTPANEASRASWMVRLLALNRIGDEHGAYHEKMFLYNMFNHGFDHSDSEDNYGLCCSWKDKKWNERSAYAAKEPYLTVAQWNKMMTEAVLTDYTVTDDTSGKLRYQAEFDRDGDKVTLLWDVYEYDEAVTLSGYDDTNQIKVYDIYGNILQELSGEKSIALKAQNTPVYVEFTNEAIYAEADGSKITSLSGMTGKSVSFNADLKEAAQKRMLIAKYDKTGILISVATKKLDESGKASMQNTIEADVFYKLMLWDFEKLKPYCEAVVLRH